MIVNLCVRAHQSRMEHEKAGHEQWTIPSPRTGDNLQVECGWTPVGRAVQWSAKVRRPGAMWHVIDGLLSLQSETPTDIADRVKRGAIRRALD